MDLDGVQIGAVDPGDAVETYRRLLGAEPERVGRASRFALERGAVEIVPGEPGLRSIHFVGSSPRGWPESFHGLRVTSAPLPVEVGVRAPGIAIDHVVVQTPDADRAIRLWRDEIGLRLALDRVFPERGLRLVFFRSGGMTLEFAAAFPPAADATAGDVFHAVSYRVADLQACRARLVAAGVDVSPIRPGMKPGTSVATVRSRTGGVPTLLLERHQ